MYNWMKQAQTSAEFSRQCCQLIADICRDASNTYDRDFQCLVVHDEVTLVPSELPISLYGGVPSNIDPHTVCRLVESELKTRKEIKDDTESNA